VSADQNSWNGTGRLCKDPELKYTNTGLAVCSIRIAVNRIPRKSGDGPNADFFNVNVWRETAEFVANYLTKGSRVAITGRLENRDWENREGQKVTSTEIIAEKLVALDSKKESDAGFDEGGKSRPKVQPEPDADEDFNDPFADE
jgi:single-strand DNA-binding protein